MCMYFPIYIIYKIYGNKCYNLKLLQLIEQIHNNTQYI